MIQFVLDTDTVTLYQRGHPLVLQHLTDRDDTGSVAVSIISVEEQLTGWYTRLRQANGRPELAHVYQRFTNAVRFLSALEILTFGEAAIERFENLRKSLRNIGKNDLRIAAIALEHNATVVTRNRTDFQRIPGLSIEDWSK